MSTIFVWSDSLFSFHYSFQKQLIWQQILLEIVHNSSGELRRITICFVQSTISLNWQKVFLDFSLSVMWRRGNHFTSTLPLLLYLVSCLQCIGSTCFREYYHDVLQILFRVIAAIFAEIKKSIQNSSLLVDFKMDHLPLLVEKIERLAELLVITSLVLFSFLFF